VINVATIGDNAMISRCFYILWLVAVQVAEQGIPRSWSDALALFLVVLRAWAASSTHALDAGPPARAIGASRSRRRCR
jgi:hypothetical protein